VPFYTVGSIIKAVGGEQNIEVLKYDPEFETKYPEYVNRWKQAFKR